MKRYLYYFFIGLLGFAFPVLAQFSDRLLSTDLAPSPSNGKCLTTNGTDNVWSTCTSGGSSSGDSTLFTLNGNTIDTDGVSTTPTTTIKTAGIVATSTTVNSNFVGFTATRSTTSAATTTNFFSSILTATTGFFTNLFGTNATITNATTTNLNVSGSFKLGSDLITDITGTNLSITNGVLNATGGSSATGTTLVCASGCPYSDIQTALDAGVRNIQLKEETYAGPLRIKFNDTKIFGAGPTSTIITCDAAVNSPCVAFATTTRLTRQIIRDFAIDNTNVSFLGTGLDTSDTSKVYASNIRVTEFNIAHLHQDTTNSSFYSHFENMDYYASSSCFKAGGTKSNDNSIDTARCIAISTTPGSAIGYGFYDAEGWLLNNINSEPGSVIGTGLYVDATSIGITVINPWFEGNATGTEIRAGALNTSIKGGRITAGTLGVYDGGTNTFLDSTLVSANTTNHSCPSTCLGTYVNTSSSFSTPHILVGTTTQNTSFTRLGLNISTSDATANMLTLNNAGAFATAPAGLQFTHSSGAFPSGTARIYANPGSGYTNANLNFAVADSSQVLRDRLTINVSGFAGLGSTTPGHLLTVAGGNAWIGGHLTATGTATFANLLSTGSSTIGGGTGTTGLTVNGSATTTATSTIDTLIVRPVSSSAPTATSTVFFYSSVAGIGGQVILEDSNGSTCTKITTLSGTITGAAITCPTQY